MAVIRVPVLWFMLKHAFPTLYFEKVFFGSTPTRLDIILVLSAPTRRTATLQSTTSTALPAAPTGKCPCSSASRRRTWSEFEPQWRPALWPDSVLGYVRFV